MSETDTEELYDVTVWDWEGNVIKKLWDATIEQVEAIQLEYADEPLYSVVVEPR